MTDSKDLMQPASARTQTNAIFSQGKVRVLMELLKEKF